MDDARSSRGLSVLHVYRRDMEALLLLCVMMRTLVVLTITDKASVVNFVAAVDLPLLLSSPPSKYVQHNSRRHSRTKKMNRSIHQPINKPTHHFPPLATIVIIVDTNLLSETLGSSAIFFSAGKHGVPGNLGPDLRGPGAVWE